jgi:hypothetical protein
MLYALTELVLETAATNEAFRSALIADGRKAVHEKFQVILPDGVTFRVLDASPDDFVLVVPAPASPPASRCQKPAYTVLAGLSGQRARHSWSGARRLQATAY